MTASLLGASADKKTRHHQSYGSALKQHTSDAFLLHDVQEGDSLQGIAIKYNVTVEAILHQNRMYASDNIHIRKTLKIPVSKDSDASSHLLDSVDDDEFEDEDSSDGKKLSRKEKRILRHALNDDDDDDDDDDDVNDSSSTQPQSQSTATPGTARLGTSHTASLSPEHQHSNALDFLKSFDTQFASIKEKLDTAIVETEKETMNIARHISQSNSSSTTRLAERQEKDMLDDSFFQL